MNKGALHKLILNTVDGLVYDFLWDNRKEDDELPRGAIEQAIASKVVTVDEIVERFRTQIEEALQ